MMIELKQRHPVKIPAENNFLSVISIRTRLGEALYRKPNLTKRGQKKKGK